MPILYLHSNEIRSEISRNVPAGSGLGSDFVAYPATPLQSGMVLASMNDPTAYVLQQAFKATRPIVAHQLQTAFRRLLMHHDILRTSFVSTSDGIYQVVRQNVDSVYISQTTTDLQQYLADDHTQGFTMQSSSWVRLALVTSRSDQHAVLTIHHALYDGWSLPFIIEDLFKTYEGQPMSDRASFHSVVNYIASRDPTATQMFWKEYLADVSISSTFNGIGPDVDDDVDEPINVPCDVTTAAMQEVARQSGVTIATILKAAWALTLRQYQRTSDVVFGFVTAGRDIPVSDVDRYVDIVSFHDRFRNRSNT